MLERGAGGMGPLREIAPGAAETIDGPTTMERLGAGEPVEAHEGPGANGNGVVVARHHVARHGARVKELVRRLLAPHDNGNVVDTVIAFEPRARFYRRVAEERRRWRYTRSRYYEEGLSSAGNADGPTWEPTYATRVPPRGMARELAEAVLLAVGGLGSRQVDTRGAPDHDHRVQGRIGKGLARRAKAPVTATVEVSVVVPARNAATFLDECLAAVVASHPREVILVDGLSSDDTPQIARRHGARVLSDEGRGLPAARMIGAHAARSSVIALIDADVVLGTGDLERLLDERQRGGYAALQAGLRSVSGPGYWGRALANHHRTGRSRNWFGVGATVFDREILLAHGFDDRFQSGEDIDLRWRLRAAGVKFGVSHETVVVHRFDDSWAGAKEQWLADGRGLARMVRAHGRRAKLLAAMPLAAAVRGIALSLVRLEPQWIPYYVCYMAYNYRALIRELARRRRGEPWRQPAAVQPDESQRIVL